MWSVFILSFLAVAVASVEFQYSKEWRLWKDEHTKNYHLEAEEMKRHSVWLTNKEYIDMHNSNADVSGYTLAMNEFGDMVSTIVEIKHYI